MSDRSAPHPADSAADKADAGQSAVILYTTGTTGAPKGVMLTHANLCFAARSSASMRGMVAHDLVYGVLPLTHVFGLASMLMACASCGACLQLEAHFRPDRLHVVDRYKELIIRSGFNVYPPEVETALNDHPSIAQSAVTGRRLDDGNEEVLAFAQCADPDAFNEAARGSLHVAGGRYRQDSQAPVAGRVRGSDRVKQMSSSAFNALWNRDRARMCAWQLQEATDQLVVQSTRMAVAPVCS